MAVTFSCRKDLEKGQRGTEVVIATKLKLGLCWVKVGCDVKEVLQKWVPGPHWGWEVKVTKNCRKHRREEGEGGREGSGGRERDGGRGREREMLEENLKYPVIWSKLPSPTNTPEVYMRKTTGQGNILSGLWQKKVRSSWTSLSI